MVSDLLPLIWRHEKFLDGYEARVQTMSAFAESVKHVLKSPFGRLRFRDIYVGEVMTSVVSNISFKCKLHNLSVDNYHSHVVIFYHSHAAFFT